MEITVKDAAADRMRGANTERKEPAFCTVRKRRNAERNMAEYRSSGKELRRSPKGAIAACLTLLLAAGAALGTLYVMKGIQPIETQTDSSSEAELSVPDMTEPADDENRIIYTYEAMFASDIHSGPLVLVNRSTPLPEDLEDGLVNVYIEKADCLHVKDAEVSLQEEAMTALNAMAEDFAAETGHKDLLIISGFRTKAYQQQLYEADLKDTGAATSSLVAKPGCSEHETGYALDFSLYADGTVTSFEGTGDYAWISAHCAEYGFVLRYPEDKVDTTEFDYEPWHFRYVGVPHATYMYENDLCLEEYIELLERYTYDGDHLQITDAEGWLYEVFTVALTDTDDAAVAEVPVPAELPYTCSGNNRDGFLVTVETGRKAEEETETAVTTDETSPAETAPADEN